MKLANRNVIFLAAFVWFSGGVVLLLKGSALAKSAYQITPDSVWIWLAPALGVTLGIVKTWLIFLKSCKKNILRIKALEAPRFWHCFRPGMIIFLAIIIPTGAWMSRAAEGKFLYLCLVCILDLSISTGLLVSGVMFWKLKAFSLEEP